MAPKPKLSPTSPGRKRATAKPEKPATPKPQKPGFDLISVMQPDAMINAFKSLAASRAGLENRRVTVRSLYDEAVRELLADLQTGRRVFFSPNPIDGGPRRSIWLQISTMETLKQTGDRLNIQYAHLVFTAFIQYLARRGVMLAGFPASFGG